MRHRLIPSLSPSPSLASRDAGAQWLCRNCLVQQSRRSITSTSSRRQATELQTTSENSIESILPARNRDDRYAELKELRLPHPIPPQLLAHVTREALTPIEKREQKHLFRWAMAGHVDDEFNPKPETARQIKGVVISAGKMDRTVKVRVPGQRYDKRVKKYFAHYTNHLTHDPNNSLREGDVVVLHKLAVSKTVKHVVASINTPFGTPMSERAPIPTPEQRLQAYKEHRIKRLEARIRRAQTDASGKTVETDPTLSKKQSKKKKQDLSETALQQVENYMAWWARRHQVDTKDLPPIRRRIRLGRKYASKDPKKDPGYLKLQKTVYKINGAYAQDNAPIRRKQMVATKSKQESAEESTA